MSLLQQLFPGFHGGDRKSSGPDGAKYVQVGDAAAQTHATSRRNLTVRFVFKRLL